MVLVGLAPWSLSESHDSETLTVLLKFCTNRASPPHPL
jgi:hypothetical protein